MSVKQPQSYPFNVTQNRLSGTASGWDRYDDTIEQRPTTPFDAVMQIENIWRGRSSTNLIARDADTHAIYEINVADALPILKTQKIDRGLIGGKWYIRKRNGGYFGLAMVGVE